MIVIFTWMTKKKTRADQYTFTVEQKRSYSNQFRNVLFAQLLLLLLLFVKYKQIKQQLISMFEQIRLILIESICAYSLTCMCKKRCFVYTHTHIHSACSIELFTHSGSCHLLTEKKKRERTLAKKKKKKKKKIFLYYCSMKKKDTNESIT